MSAKEMRKDVRFAVHGAMRKLHTEGGGYRYGIVKPSNWHEVKTQGYVYPVIDTYEGRQHTEEFCRLSFLRAYLTPVWVNSWRGREQPAREEAS